MEGSKRAKQLELKQNREEINNRLAEDTRAFQSYLSSIKVWEDKLKKLAEPLKKSPKPFF